MTLTDFVFAVYSYTMIAGASVKSWIRTADHNRAVGGVTHSAHIVGLAVDVVYDSAIPEATRREWATRLGLYLHVESDHDHLQPLGWKAG